ncbi:DNA polymerase I [Candidatus Dependentiae bacterium]|nr:DNA polymerase I [Candidatus Dependentiae bacterium]
MQRIKKDSLFLIDGSSLLYRSYYGLRPLQTSQGIPTQAIYGFCRAIKKLIDDFDPQYLIIAWDSKGKTFRNKIFEAYKATRQAPPSDLFLQKEQILKIIDTVKIAQISKAGYEADDLIYSIEQDYKDKPIVLIGPDKDLHQLISPKLIILDPLKKEIIDTKVFTDKRGFAPEKLAFYHAIVGDASDNIPGVRGIGKKGAAEIVKQFESLDELYQNLDKIKKERIRNLLEAGKKNAFLSLKLFSLMYVKTPMTLNKMSFNKNNWKNANQLFQELEFKSLIEKDEQTQTTFLQKQDNRKSQAKKTLWTCIIIRDSKALKNLILKLKEKKLFALDTETTGLDPLQERMVGLSIAYDTKKSYYIPFEQELLKSLAPILTSKTIKKTLHNAKFDQLVLWNQGIELDGIDFDTLLAANLLRKESDRIGLKKLSLRYLEEKMDSFKEVLGKQYKTFDQVPIPEAATYAAHDALQTLKLTKLLKKELSKEKKLQKIFKTIELPLSRVLFDIERTGMLLDPTALKELEKKVTRKLHTIESKIFGSLNKKQLKLYGDINLNSPKQIETLLFDELKLPIVKKSIKGQRSTDQEVLTQLSEQHPVPGLILQYREFFKLKSTYIESLPRFVNPKTKRVHTSFSQTIAATGRLSSSNPNLQNIPATGELGLLIREAFIAPHGKQLLSADYSQIELRVLAHVTGCKNLTEAFLHGQDIHQRTASQIFEIPLNKVTHEQRQMGKRINFGIVYGLTPYGLAKDLGIKQGDAKTYIQKYFEQYPEVAKWIEKTVAQAEASGFVETWLGRKRYVPGLREQNRTLYEAARRIAVNTPMQGTAAEIMKLAMLNVHGALKTKKLESAIILQIHDELLFECPNSEVKEVEHLVKKTMESVVSWKIPFLVAIRTGKNWAKITK